MSFDKAARVGLTSGASAPEVLVNGVIARIKALGAVSVRKMDGVEETMKFPLPKGLKMIDPATGLEIESAQGAPKLALKAPRCNHQNKERLALAFQTLQILNALNCLYTKR